MHQLLFYTKIETLFNRLHFNFVNENTPVKLKERYELLSSNRLINTPFANRRKPTSISTFSQPFLNSFLPRSIRDLRILSHNTNLAEPCAKIL